MASSQTWTSPDDAYHWLLRHSRETGNMESMAALLHWDQRTNIPPKGHEHRAEVLAQLAGMIHERQVDPHRGEALAFLEARSPSGDTLSDRAVNLREWRRDYDRMAKIPQKLAVELAKAAAEAETAWERARPVNDWAGFFPHLERLLGLRHEEAEAVGYDTEPYDALLDDYEPGERAASLEPLFASLRGPLRELLQRIQQAPRKPDASALEGDFPVEAQRAFALETAAALGYDLDAGRLDVSAHPFSTTIGPRDSRITTRFDPNHFSDGFFSVAHEAGHALYEQGLPKEQWGCPMGQPASFGVHESQSRLWENIVARSPAFWQHFYPKAQARFPRLRDVAQDDFVGAVNVVASGLIRTEADEVTYNLHVMLRFELELALFRGQLEARDLPEAWNGKMRDLLGLTPPDMASGVLQDVHWSAGLFGYFPTYTLGNLMAAQLYHAAEKELGVQDEAFARGEFTPLLAWLRKTVHAHGRRHHPRALVREVTGEELNPEYLLAFLNRKFARIYGF